jgi:hypothetical protein
MQDSVDGLILDGKIVLENLAKLLQYKLNTVQT